MESCCFHCNWVSYWMEAVFRRSVNGWEGCDQQAARILKLNGSQLSWGCSVQNVRAPFSKEKLCATEHSARRLQDEGFVL